MKTEIDLYIIGRVKEMRIGAEMSQRALSELLDRSLGFVGQVETPHCPAKYSVHQLYIIANEFNCSVSEFYPPEGGENRINLSFSETCVHKNFG